MTIKLGRRTIFFRQGERRKEDMISTSYSKTLKENTLASPKKVKGMAQCSGTMNVRGKELGKKQRKSAG